MLQKIVVPFCPTPVKPSHTFPPLFLMSFFSLLDNFLFFVVQPLLYSSTRNYLSISCFSFSLSLQKFSKTGNFFISALPKVSRFRELFSDAKIGNYLNFQTIIRLFFQKNSKKIVFPLPYPVICTFHSRFLQFHPHSAPLPPYFLSVFTC